MNLNKKTKTYNLKHTTMKTKLYAILILAVSLFTACDVEDVKPDENLPVATDNILVLSEGTLNHNNSTLAHYNLTEKITDLDYFQTKNGRGLGDLANDMIKYGNKIYIVLNGSSRVEVINAATGISLKQIPLFNGEKAKEPRYICSHKGKVYVSSFDDTVTRIDTTTLAIDGSVNVGRDPEQLCVVNEKLYVTNSGGMEWATGNYDKTVSVVDLTTFIETEKITVGVNPVKIKADDNGYLYVLCNGNYGTEPAKFQRIDTKTNTVKTYADISVSNYTIYDNKMFFYSYDNIVKVFDCTTEKITNEKFITDDTTFDLPYIYSMQIDSYNGNVYFTDTNYFSNGNVYCYDKNGILKYKILNVGLFSNKILFLE